MSLVPVVSSSVVEKTSWIPSGGDYREARTSPWADVRASMVTIPAVVSPIMTTTTTAAKAET